MNREKIWRHLYGRLMFYQKTIPHDDLCLDGYKLSKIFFSCSFLVPVGTVILSYCIGYFVLPKSAIKPPASVIVSRVFISDMKRPTPISKPKPTRTPKPMQKPEFKPKPKPNMPSPLSSKPGSGKTPILPKPVPPMIPRKVEPYEPLQPSGSSTERTFYPSTPPTLIPLVLPSIPARVVQPETPRNSDGGKVNMQKRFVPAPASPPATTKVPDAISIRVLRPCANKPQLDPYIVKGMAAIAKNGNPSQCVDPDNKDVFKFIDTQGIQTFDMTVTSKRNLTDQCQEIANAIKCLQKNH